MKTFLKIITAFVLCGLITTCAYQIDKSIKYQQGTTKLSTEVRILTLTHVNYPKHFAVYGVDNTGQEWRRVATSKHCNGARHRVFEGDRYKIYVSRYKGPDGKVWDQLHSSTLNTTLCR